VGPLRRILTSPVRLSGGLHLAHLTMLASADALVRYHRAAGIPVTWEAACMAGDLGAQAAVERQLSQAGQRRADLGREAFVERVRAFEVDCRAQVAAQLGHLGIEADLESGAIDQEAVAKAARTAFVRLYEAGLLSREERVVAACPRCETVVDRADVTGVDVPEERLTLRLERVDGDGVVNVSLVEVELLPGVVAVAVPPDDPAAGHRVEVPLAGGPVPVTAEPGLTEAQLVVPAHDAEALTIARRLGLAPVEVLDAAGVVRVAGPLDGLARYAARTEAREVLVAEGAVVSTAETVERHERCRRCGTVLVPRLGQHWFLPMADLEVAAADVMRQGAVEFAPASARDDLLTRAGHGGDWCLSHQVWAGQPVPVATCLDCGSLDVAVEPSTSCGKCMGTLAAGDDVLDARFIGALWPLSAAGWPDDQAGPAAAAAETMLVVSAIGVAWWALPMAALGVRLAEVVPFAYVAAEPVAATEDDPDPSLPVDLERRTADTGHRAVRAALVAGGLDLDAGRALVELVEAPPAGEGSVDEFADACIAAYEAGTPSGAVAQLAGFLPGGVHPADVPRVLDLAAPILGD
jgi:valyl-tRNA synthetase